MYSDYQKEFPDCQFKQPSLKDSVRKALRELKTGNSNEAGSEKAVLQKDSVLQQLKMTDGHAKRNILQQREKIISNFSTGNRNAVCDLSSSQEEAQSDEKTSGCQRATKAQTLELQAKSIASMSENFAFSSRSRSDYLEKKLEILDYQKLQMERKLKRARLSDLKEAKSLGLVTEEEFASEARKCLNL